MMNMEKRLDLLHLSADLAKVEAAAAIGSDISLAQRTTEIFQTLKTALDDGSVLEETNIGDVKSAVDVAASIEDLMD